MAQEVPVVQLKRRAMRLHGAEVSVLRTLTFGSLGEGCTRAVKYLTFTSAFWGPRTFRKSATGSSHFHGVPRTAP